MINANCAIEKPPTDRNFDRGRSIVNCLWTFTFHDAIRGVAGANAIVAPDLTHVASRKQIGAGILENTPANMRKWLKNPQHVKPGVLMPDFNFTGQQLDELTAYLDTLR